ncbi:hypothetical protein FAES_5103 [Fibrella aestuarina BUZ 2]|uniref:Beta-lactamase class A catalytic domain-containing protein n=1 Tax=Fibrella aestuarina BUZ 2 TaxID=1166018 RepID=I0KG49_9BACT|nr:serine hydrolase [Fibrella aestuarina]CCH03102.1 hypothetical protein FAES_5103 [Fibrella aestuarina BUZ 2]
MNPTTSTNWPRRFSTYCSVALLCATLAATPALAQSPNLGKTDKLLADLLASRPDQFSAVLAHPERHDVQIIYTQIDRDAQNRPSFRTFQYRVDKDRYFYPASTVKLPAVLMALEKLNKLGIPRDTPMITDSAYSGQKRVWRDTTARNGKPSVTHYAKKILLVSDNDAYNRLYELLGQCAFNDDLRAKGYLGHRFTHRLSLPLTPDQNAHTNPVTFLTNQNTSPVVKISDMGQLTKTLDTTLARLMTSLPAQFCDHTPAPAERILRGTGYMAGGSFYAGDSLVKQPFDFTGRNCFPLEEQQAILRAVLFPEAVPANQRFQLTPDDYRFVYQHMSQLPRETRWPNYQADPALYDSYCKFLLVGDRKTPLPSSIRIFNKVGDAYGYLLDNAYIVDFDKGIEFMVTAMISCNSDGIFNDDKYDYDTVGFPFMGNLGRLIYDYEATRKKPRQPDLSRFKLTYGE